MSSKKAELRALLINKRESLSKQSIASKSSKTCKKIASLETFKTANHIAFYNAFKGEIDPISLLEYKNNKQQFYLPNILSNKELLFTELPQDTQSFHKNKYGILEPRTKSNHSVNASELDLIIIPLVGCDLTGNRLGMGGGYYDRTLSKLDLKDNKKHRPYLLGIAYDFQVLKQKLETESWDIPLDGLVTESKQYTFSA